jgi:hypothetical protein
MSQPDVSCVTVHSWMPDHQVREGVQRFRRLHDFQLGILSVVHSHALRHGGNQVCSRNHINSHTVKRHCKGNPSLLFARSKSLIGYRLRSSKSIDTNMQSIQVLLSGQLVAALPIVGNDTNNLLFKNHLPRKSRRHETVIAPEQEIDPPPVHSIENSISQWRHRKRQIASCTAEGGLRQGGQPASLGASPAGLRRAPWWLRLKILSGGLNLFRISPAKSACRK